MSDDDENYNDQVFDEQADLSLEEILNMNEQDLEYLSEQVFMVLNERQLDSNIQDFWKK